MARAGTGRLGAWLLAGLGMVGLVGGLGAYKYFEISAAIAAGEAWPEQQEAVVGARVAAGSFAATSRGVGTVVSVRRVELRNELPGRVTEVNFDSGRTVAAGDVLVRFDTAQEEADLAALKAEAELARQTLDRQQRLVRTQASAESALDQAQAQLGIMRARIQALEVQIAKKTLRAPFDARVGLRDLQPGAYLSEGTPIAMLQGVDPDAYVDFSFAQDIAPALPVGATVTLTGEHFPQGAVQARIVAREAAVDDTARTLRFRAVAAGLGDSLTPGAFVDVTAQVGEARPALFVPLPAVRRAPYGDHVFVIAMADDGKLRASQRFVRTGPVRDGDIAVLHGLTEGELVAADGSFKLRDGLLVTVKEAESAPTGPGVAQLPPVTGN